MKSADFLKLLTNINKFGPLLNRQDPRQADGKMVQLALEWFKAESPITGGQIAQIVEVVMGASKNHKNMFELLSAPDVQEQFKTILVDEEEPQDNVAICSGCMFPFETSSQPGDDVTCPHCRTRFTLKG